MSVCAVRRRARALRLGAYVMLLGQVACGGGSGSLSSSTSSGTGGSGPVAAAPNVVSVAVTGGPGNDNVNTLYTTLTVCKPGTSTCQTIDNIQVDTGSYGLRILSQALTLSLPVTTTANGEALLECTEFLDGYSWGPLAEVDVKVSGESASSVAVQLIGDPRYPNVPAECASGAPTAEDTVAAFGANGILGVGPFAQDCGTYCVDNIPSPAVYYACSSSSACQGTTLALASQVQNPVTLFAKDNNGTIISLPGVPAGGEASVSGSLIFGIDTESNNASGTVSVVPVTTEGPFSGLLTTDFNGQTLSASFVDSGSNAYYFDDSSIPECSSNSNSQSMPQFYCPASLQSLSAMFPLSSGRTVTVSFEAGNADELSASFTAFPDLAGTNPTSGSFDWGLPFFYGRRVLTAIQGYSTSAGAGPYIAF
ncbi:MAG TPA: DUF3443 domain-containing protein [Steroidobacteraceae bacterium]|nr:DUF3443 domain-containing protein [Steroidobacteraceae bacterium]